MNLLNEKVSKTYFMFKEEHSQVQWLVISLRFGGLILIKSFVFALV